MNIKTLFILVTVSLVMMLWVGPAASGQTGTDEQRAAYAKLIDCCTACCDAKSALRNSRSKNLRQKAKISCLKAAYLKNYKGIIVEELIENDVTPELYKVQYVVNSMFYDLLRREVTTTHKGVVQVGYTPVD
ncbi:MAG: hypothetical protein U9Q05_06420 [Thermodesulfobacteriota bacterium]|nr:hypothetical protein [Thermodesulfobacteriota bacterium]